jgi:hypothetical protein
MVVISEQIDHGHIMELDAAAVVSRVMMKASETASAPVSPSKLSAILALFHVDDISLLYLVHLVRSPRRLFVLATEYDWGFEHFASIGHRPGTIYENTFKRSWRWYLTDLVVSLLTCWSAP